MTRTAWIGLGRMGLPMVRRLRALGVQPAVWTRREAVERCAASGGERPAESPRACATDADVIFTCLFDDGSLLETLGGEEGILAGLRKGAWLVDLSTLSLAGAQEVERRVREAGGHFAACPVLGAPIAAANGKLVALLGSQSAVPDEIRNLITAFAAKTLDAGGVTHAVLLKLAVNTLGSAMMAGLCEALALGEAGGLSRALVLEAVGASALASPLTANKGRKMLEGDWSPQGTVRVGEKDLRLIVQAAAALELSLPVTAESAALYTRGLNVNGGRHAEDDMAVLCELEFGVLRRSGE